MRIIPSLTLFTLTLVLGAGGTLATLSSAGSAPAEPPTPESVTDVLAETDTAVPYTLSEFTYAPTDPVGTDSLNAKIARMIAVALQLRPQAPVIAQGSGTYSQADLDRVLDIARRNNENTRSDISRSIASSISDAANGGALNNVMIDGGTITNVSFERLDVEGSISLLNSSPAPLPPGAADGAKVGLYAKFSGGSNSDTGVFIDKEGGDLQVLVGRTAAPSFPGHHPRIQLFRGDGTLDMPLNTKSGHWLGQIEVGGFDGQNWVRPGASGILFGASGNWSTTSRPYYIDFRTAGTNESSALSRMRILADGNVGIGTVVPAFKTEIVGGSNGAETIALALRSNFNDDNTATTLRFGNSIAPTSVLGTAEISALRVGGAGSNLIFRTSTGGAVTERVRIASNGNVGIGTSNPLAALHVAHSGVTITGNPTYRGQMILESGQTDAATNGLELKGSGAGNGAGFRLATVYDGLSSIDFRLQSRQNSATWSNPLVIRGSTANVGIGTTTPQTKLQVDGVITPALDNTYTLGNSTYRFSELYAANGVINTSDMRLKHNPQTLTYGLDTILALEPISYTWVDQPAQGARFGLSAQHVRDLIPEIVAVGTDSNKTLGIRYTELIPILINALQELAGKVATLAEGSFDTVFAKKVVVEIGEFERIEVKEDVRAKQMVAEEDVRASRDLRSDGRLCLEDLCITRADLAAILESQTGQVVVESPTPAAPTPEPTPEAETDTSEVTSDKDEPIEEVNEPDEPTLPDEPGVEQESDEQSASLPETESPEA